jgi:hypothetical protein
MYCITQKYRLTRVMELHLIGHLAVMSQFSLRETLQEEKLVFVFPPSLLSEFVLLSPIISYTPRVLKHKNERQMEK